jgi:hypothetical protein
MKWVLIEDDELGNDNLSYLENLCQISFLSIYLSHCVMCGEKSTCSSLILSPSGRNPQHSSIESIIILR